MPEETGDRLLCTVRLKHWSNGGRGEGGEISLQRLNTAPLSDLMILIESTRREKERDNERRLTLDDWDTLPCHLIIIGHSP
jgi:hypothetical protein